MILCRSSGCHFENLNDALFCELCGNRLEVAVQERGDTTYSNSNVGESARFVVSGSNQEITLMDLLHLLRRTSSSLRVTGSYVVPRGIVDLVRRNAKHIQMTIHHQEKQVTLWDIGGQEGVKVNGQILPPLTPYRMRNRDVIVDLGIFDIVQKNGKSIDEDLEIRLRNGDQFTLDRLTVYFRAT